MGHTKPLTTTPVDTRSLSGGDYVADLMSQVENAAISQRLQRARRDAGLTQDQMAELLFVHPNTIGNWETPNKTLIPYNRIAEWAKFTNVTPEWLLHGVQPGDQVTPEQLVDLEARLGRVEQLQHEHGALLEEIRELLQARPG